MKKIPGLSYACTGDGIELPVLDITHPLFIESADESAFVRLSKKAVYKAEIMNNLPGFMKRLIARMAKTENTHLSGMRTLIIKLGPRLIKGRKIEFWYRLGSRQFNVIAVRIRLRNICRLQAEILIPPLSESNKNLCFINIGGGAANDSINTLILLLKEYPALLKNRKIEINVLDIDSFGPGFAAQSIIALKKYGCLFNGLDISFRYIQYNWENTEKLTGLLSERTGWIQICSSEGGLFEYGSDDDILRNLDTLYCHSSDELKIAGSLLYQKGVVNPVIPAGSAMMGVTLKFLGLEGLNVILKRTGWFLDRTVGDGSIYVSFVLTKRLSAGTSSG
jgi:hypothetical protein